MPRPQPNDLAKVMGRDRGGQSCTPHGYELVCLPYRFDQLGRRSRSHLVAIAIPHSEPRDYTRLYFGRVLGLLRRFQGFPDVFQSHSNVGVSRTNTLLRYYAVRTSLLALRNTHSFL